MNITRMPANLNLNALQSSSFSLFRNFLLVNLEDNLHEQGIDELETRLLVELKNKKDLRGVLFNCFDLLTTDHQDLKRLSLMMDSIRLLGVAIGIYGVSPGLAVIIVSSGVKMKNVSIGADLDDLLVKMQK